MNDFDFDVMQKKRIANNAAHMKRGSKSKKCSLPSDHMTPAEWKRRNGPVSTYSLNKPMDWETFKSLPVDIQQSYIDILQSRFNVTTSAISRDLFGKTGPTLKNHMEKTGIKYIQMKGRNMSAEEKDLWKSWLSPVAPEWAPAEEDPAKVQQFLDELSLPEETKEKGDISMEIPMEECDKANEPAPREKLPRELMVERAKEAIKPDILSLDKLSATFSGDFDAEAFLRWVTRLPMPEGKVCIKVEVMAL